MPLVEIWLVTSLLGLLASGVGIPLAISDVRFAANLNSSDNGFVLVASQRLFAQIVRSLAFLGWALIGFLTLDTEVRLSLAVVVFILGNVAFTAVAVTDTLLGLYLRRRAQRNGHITTVIVKGDSQVG